mgnify:CR=1 FL=1
MIGKFITKAQDWADGKLRRLAGRISPDMRVAIILVMLAAFGALSVYMTVGLHLPHRQERREGTGDRAYQAPATTQ